MLDVAVFAAYTVGHQLSRHSRILADGGCNDAAKHEAQRRSPAVYRYQ